MKEFFEKKSVQTIMMVAYIALITVVSAFYSYLTYVRTGQMAFLDDLSFHVNRMQSIADGIMGGQFPVVIYPNVLNGFGYASPLFYPDLFLYPFALLVTFGMDVVLASYFLMLAILWAMSFTMYFFARKFLPHWGALIASLFYITIQYSTADIINRAAIGESLGLVFLPLILLGLYNMTKEDFSKPWILLIGVVGVTYSHTISLYLDAWLIVVVTLINAKKLFVNKMWWLKVGILLGSYVLIAGAYLFPLLEMFLSSNFGLSNSDPWLNTQALTLDQLLSSRYAIGPFALIAMILRPFLKKTEENKDRLKLMDSFLYPSILFVSMSLTIFPWKLFNPLFENVQFPWRLNAYACPLLAIYFVLLICELVKSPKQVALVSVVLALCMCVYNISYLVPNRDLLNFDYNYVGAGEWIPQEGHIWDKKEGAITSVLDASGNPVSFERKENSVEITFEATGDNSYQVPLFYYKGYEAVLVRNDGTTIPLEIQADQTSGMRVATNGEQGIVTISYQGTIVQKASMIVSCVATVLVAGGFVTLEVKKRKNL